MLVTGTQSGWPLFMLMPNSAQRLQLLEQAAQHIDQYYEQLENISVSPKVSSDDLRKSFQLIDFENENELNEILDSVYVSLRDGGMNVAHPSYYGLFNPTPSFAGVLADLLAAALNPQLGAWHHHPFGVEMERYLIKYFAKRFGLPVEQAYGSFTTGGSEANSTGVMLALTRQFPDFARKGIRGLSGQPVFYCSAEFHHSFEKIAHTCGLGRDAVRTIATDENYRLSTDLLDVAVQTDREQGFLPFMVVATAGTTNAGVIDPMADIATICRREQLHLHVDAAWGGAVILSDTLKGQLDGIEHADTITFDPHKFLSVPMAAGMLISRKAHWLADTFHIDPAYVPESAEVGLDNYRLSLQFSRRIIGLKLFMTLASIGRQGYAQTLEHQVGMAEYLAEQLTAYQWRVLNQTGLAIVCFEDMNGDGLSREQRATQQAAIVDTIVESGLAWISVTSLAGLPVIRVCITSYLTQTHHIDGLVELLEKTRESLV